MNCVSKYVTEKKGREKDGGTEGRVFILIRMFTDGVHHTA